MHHPVLDHGVSHRMVGHGIMNGPAGVGPVGGLAGAGQHVSHSSELPSQVMLSSGIRGHRRRNLEEYTSQIDAGGVRVSI